MKIKILTFTLAYGNSALQTNGNNTDSKKEDSENLNGLLEEIENDYNDTPVKKSNINIVTTNKQEDFLNKLEESPVVPDMKPDESPQKFEMGNEMGMEDINSGFKENNDIMKFDMEEPEPGNINDSIQPFENEAHKMNNKEEDVSPNQFVLDDLMDEFDVSKGKKDNLKINETPKKEAVKDDDLLDDFNW